MKCVVQCVAVPLHDGRGRHLRGGMHPHRTAVIVAAVSASNARAATFEGDMSHTERQTYMQQTAVRVVQQTTDTAHAIIAIR